MKPAIKPDGFESFEMLLVYVDDIISISDNPILAIDGIKATFRLKGNKAEVSNIYLGGDIKQVLNTSGIKCWTFSSEKYVKTAVSNVEDKLEESLLRLPSKCITPFRFAYHPSENTSRELDTNGTRYYRELIGVLHWVIKLGRVDILLEVSLLLSHVVLPRIRHLQQVYHIFGYQ